MHRENDCRWKFPAKIYSKETFVKIIHRKNNYVNEAPWTFYLRRKSRQKQQHAKIAAKNYNAIAKGRGENISKKQWQRENNSDNFSPRRKIMWNDVAPNCFLGKKNPSKKVRKARKTRKKLPRKKRREKSTVNLISSLFEWLTLWGFTSRLRSANGSEMCRKI